MKQKNYSATVFDHYHNPRNFGKLEMHTHTFSNLNPLCGDEVTVYLKIRKLKIENCSYEARGCALSIAAASVISEAIKGKTISGLKKLELADVKRLLRVKTGKARESCLTLALLALKKSIN